MWRSSLYTAVSVVGVIAIATTCCAVPLGRWTCSPEYTVTECVESISAASPAMRQKRDSFYVFCFWFGWIFFSLHNGFFCAFAFGFGFNNTISCRNVLCCSCSGGEYVVCKQQQDRSPIRSSWKILNDLHFLVDGHHHRQSARQRMGKTVESWRRFFFRNLHNWGISMWIVES